MTRLRQGTALITVLLASAVLVVVCFSLATMAVLNLNLAGSFSTRAQSLLMAEAAAQQLMAELDRAQQSDAGNATELTGVKGPDLRARFAQPVFPEGTNRFPGEVTITFDTSHDHYSVDNSYNAGTAAGWFDRLTIRKSVPPYSIDLLTGVHLNGRTTWYEVVLRRRWPYALCTTGRVTLMGAPTFLQNHKTVTVAPSAITGNIYNLTNADFSLPDAQEPGPVCVDSFLIHNLLGLLPDDHSIVNVGGTASLQMETSTGYPDPPVRIPPIQIVSAGNSLIGDVDVYANDPTATVEVYPQNTAVGSLRRNVQMKNIVANLQSAFHLPATGGYKELQMQAPPPGSPPPEPPVIPDPGPGPSTGPGPSPGTGPDPSPGNGSGPGPSPGTGAGTGPSPGTGPVPAPRPPPPPYYFLFHDLVLQGSRPAGAADEQKSFDYDSTSRYKISMSGGNRFVLPGNRRQVFFTGAGIELHDCILYVQGNLDLSSTRPDPGQTTIPPALRGSNATIIVDGTLILNNGSLSASNEGMVVYCRRLISATQGQYRGLIMVEKSAAICPAYPGAVIDIQGGIVCGGAPVALSYFDDSSPNPEAPSPGLFLQGLHLWSTRLTYDPKYLKTLNRFGPLTVLSLRQIE
jgi:hypothetical protein